MVDAANDAISLCFLVARKRLLVTAPYFHDGSIQTWDVMDHYNKGDGIRNPWLDEDMSR